MIAAQELVTWRAYAPWSSDVMVEQDYLLCSAVAAIFEDPFLSGQLAMRGGTVLHKGHLAPASRYSEDIDLVLVGGRPRAHIKKALARVLRPLFGRPTESAFADITLAVRNLVAKSTILRTTYTYSPTAQEAALGKVKLEVNLNETKSFYPLVSLEMAVPAGAATRKVRVVTYDLDEMLATKLRALLQREHGRDLFDLWWAWRTAAGNPGLQLDPHRIGAAFRFYMAQEGSSFRAEDVRAELARRLRSRSFLSDMDGYLPVGQTYDPQQAYADFCTVFLPHLDP